MLMQEMKTSLSCYLCFLKIEDYIDIFSEEGVQLNVKSILLQHYGFLESISDENDSKLLCACCWKMTKEFHDHFSRIQSLWDKESFNFIDIKIEVDIEPNEICNIPNDLDNAIESKLEPNFQSSDECLVSDIGVEHSFLTTSVSQSDAPKKPRAKRKKKKNLKKDKLKATTLTCQSPTIDEQVKKSLKSTKPKASKMPLQLKLTQEEEEAQKRLKIDFEDHLIREYFKMNCDVCGDSFETFLEIKNHFRETHQSDGYLACCGKRLKRRRALLDHISRHVNPDLFKCIVCDKYFADAPSLKTHINAHLPIEERPFKCKQCPNAFAKNFMLSQHLRQSHGANDGIFTCDDCNKTFPKKSAIKHHMINVHETEFKHICDICAKVFKGKGNLKAHKLQHFENLPSLQCSICGAWLKNKSSLRMHIQRHNSTEAKCTICNKVAQNKQALSRHIKNVHSEASLKCEVCKRAFKKKIYLKEHMALHTGEDLYTCPYCPKTFKSNANMHSHRKKRHPAEFSADREKRLRP